MNGPADSSVTSTTPVKQQQQLTCILQSSTSSSLSQQQPDDVPPAADPNNTPIYLPIRQDPDKKSVYWVDPPPSECGSYYYTTATNPAECILTRTPNSDAGATPSSEARSNMMDQQFYFGGFQLWSSASQVEVYYCRADGVATLYDYLTTVKGLKQPPPQSSAAHSSSNGKNESPQYYKAMCVVPGGPRPVTAVKLKLLVATTTTNIQLDQIRWTLRVPVSAPPPLPCRT